MYNASTTRVHWLSHKDESQFLSTVFVKSFDITNRSATNGQLSKNELLHLGLI